MTHRQPARFSLERLLSLAAHLWRGGQADAHAAPTAFSILYEPPSQISR